MTRKDLAALLLIGLLAFIAYSNAFHGEFQYDDDRLIRFNFALRDLSAWQNVLKFEPFRPIPVLTYSINFNISGKEPFSYHVFDFALHISVTFLFYFFLRRLGANILTAFFSAALFGVHPLNTESVSYIASRPILLCALFYWAALFCFDTHLRKPAWFKLAGFFLFFTLALFSKEEAALIPAAALLYNYAFFGAESVKKQGLFHIVTFILVLCGVLFRLHIALMVTDTFPYPVSVYIPTEMYVWLRYIGLAIFPVPLNVDHFVEPLHLLHWKFWISLCVVGVLLFGLWKSRRKHPWIFFFGIWFLLNLAASSLIPLNDFMAEHRTYLSMFGFCACLAYVISIAGPTRRLIPFALSCLLMFYVAGTWKRNLVWQKKITLWADAVMKSPQKSRPHQNLAFVLFQLGQHDAALRECLIARSLNPHSPYVHSGLGFILLSSGRPEQAEKSFRESLKIDPGFVDPKTGLGIIHYNRNQYSEAITYFEQVYPHRRESRHLIIMMSDSYLSLGQNDAAARILADASDWEPSFELVLALVEAGDTAKAQDQLRNLEGTLTQ